MSVGDFLGGPDFSSLLFQFSKGLIGAPNWNVGLARGFGNLDDYAEQQQQKRKYQGALDNMFAPPKPDPTGPVSVTPQVSDVTTGSTPQNAQPFDQNPQIAQQRQQALLDNAFPMTTPGPLYGTPLQSALPLLQQMDAKTALPLLLKTDVFKPKGKMLTQQEALSMGLPNAQNQAYALGTDGIPKPVGKTDVMSPGAYQQKVDLQNANPYLPIARENADIAAQRLAYDKSQNEGMQLDPATTDYVATSYALTGKMPPLGYGKSAAAQRAAVLKRSAELTGKWGLSPMQGVGLQAGYKANSAALGKVTQMSSAVNSYEQTMLQNMDLAKGLMAKGAGTFGAPVVNRWQRYIKGQYKGDPDVAAFNTAIMTVQNEYAKIQSGSLGNQPVSDSARSEAHKMLNPDMNPDQIMANFDYMTKEVGNRSQSLTAQQQALHDAITGASGFTGIPQQPPVALPQQTQQPPGTTQPGTVNYPRVNSDADYSRIPKGSPYIAPDGSLRTKQ